MGGLMSKSKGKLGELEVSKLVQSYGFQARRGQQFQGGPGSPDVVHSIDGIHIEVKRSEQINLYRSLEQAKRDSKIGEIPVVFHRKNRENWLVIMSADDFLRMVTPHEKAQ